ncbi:MAG: dTMP kinase [Calditrichaeota bacterium]|nr:dTMP kinase [Calditrichota bacterium]MBT7788461.1 dTMP kinase [Calditrichota bacterium]
MSKGKLIVFEGIDGCGKTTQAKKLLAHFQAKGVQATLYREPGATQVGEEIRNILLAKKDFQGGLGAHAEFLLFAAARAELARLILKPQLEQGTTVILDRFALSSIVYQGFARGVDIEFIKMVNHTVTAGTHPDKIFLLDIDPKIGMSRFEGSSDRIEQKGLDFFEKVRQGYLKVANSGSCVISLIDGASGIEEVFEQVLSNLP